MRKFWSGELAGVPDGRRRWGALRQAPPLCGFVPPDPEKVRCRMQRTKNRDESGQQLSYTFKVRRPLDGVPVLPLGRTCTLLRSPPSPQCLTGTRHILDAQ